jgi:hypothetical protein
MDDKIIDLGAERSKRDQPDPEFCHKDDFGRPMYTFLLSYQMDGSPYGWQVIAYDWADAEARVRAMRESLKVDGQLFSQVPA